MFKIMRALLCIGISVGFERIIEMMYVSKMKHMFDGTLPLTIYTYFTSTLWAGLFVFMIVLELAFLAITLTSITELFHKDNE